MFYKKRLLSFEVWNENLKMEIYHLSPYFCYVLHVAVTILRVDVPRKTDFLKYFFVFQLKAVISAANKRY